MSSTGAVFAASVDEAVGVAAGDEAAVEVAAVVSAVVVLAVVEFVVAEFEDSELPATGATPGIMRTLTVKLPVQGGVPAAFTPKNRCPGPSDLS
jgi:hypothetical protein